MKFRDTGRGSSVDFAHWSSRKVKMLVSFTVIIVFLVNCSTVLWSLGYKSREYMELREAVSSNTKGIGGLTSAAVDHRTALRVILKQTQAIARKVNAEVAEIVADDLFSAGIESLVGDRSDK